jgi:hypothetical protein
LADIHSKLHHPDPDYEEFNPPTLNRTALQADAKTSINLEKNIMRRPTKLIKEITSFL